MVTFPYFRKCAAVLAGLGLLGLGGCQKSETPTQTAEAPASPTPASATPNSFNDVTAQLDPGGDFYLYLSTAQWLGNLSHGLDTLHNIMLSGSASQTPEALAQSEKGFALLKDVVNKSGLEDITGIGASSFNYAPGLYRSKFFVHHYPANGSGILWSLYGAQPHALTGLDLLPTDTAFAGMGDFDLAQLINFLRQEAAQSGLPQLQQAVTQWQTQFAGVSGLKLDDVLASLNGSLGTVLTLDATENISIPVNGQALAIPTPRLAILIAVKNDLIFKQVDKMAGGIPGVIKVDEPDVQMRTVGIPNFQFINLRITLAQWNGYLVIASDDKLIRDMIAVQKGGPGFKSTPEYAAVSAGLPQQGNSFGISSQRFADTVSTIQNEIMANKPGTTPTQLAVMQRLQKTGHFMSVGTVLPNGRLVISQGTQGVTQMMAPILAPAFLAGLTAPAINAMRHPAYAPAPPAPPSTFSPSTTPPFPPGTPGTSP